MMTNVPLLPAFPFPHIFFLSFFYHAQLSRVRSNILKFSFSPAVCSFSFSLLHFTTIVSESMSKFVYRCSLQSVCAIDFWGHFFEFSAPPPKQIERGRYTIFLALWQFSFLYSSMLFLCLLSKLL